MSINNKGQQPTSSPQKKSKFRLTDNPVVSIIVIAVLLSFWYIVVPAIVGAILLYMYCKEVKEIKAQRLELERTQILYQKEIQKNYDKLNAEKEELERRYSEGHLAELRQDVEEAELKLQKQIQKVQKTSALYKAVKTYTENFGGNEFSKAELEKIRAWIEDIDVENLMEPTVELKLHNSDVKDLKKQYREINKQIDFVLTDYERRYTTKGNLAIYRLTVVALRSELQNVLYTMKYGKLEEAENAISEIADKYMVIATDGNQSIAPTLVRFITEAKSLFIDAARVEYEYYIRRERMKEEQKALRDKMRQEAEERRRLEEEKKKLAAEESKYTNEMSKLQAQMNDASEEKAKLFEARIAELEALLSKVNENKETIAKLQNGKAGCVYVISNLGSFGDHVFKIGMTRRLQPQERVDELGDASVPFSFDVHCFIFSEDASTLETAIHHRLNEKRVNKVNLRKEFFDISIDELEALVYELDPSAEFNRTMVAEQYRQSLSMTNVYETFDTDGDDDLDEADDIA